MSLKGLTEVVARSTAFNTLAREIREGDARTALGLPRAARPVVVAALQQALRCPIVYVTASVEASRIATDALANLSDLAPLRFAEPNTAFYDTVAPVRDVIAQRSIVLAALANPTSTLLGEGSVVITSPRALMQPALPVAQFKLITRTIKLDAALSLESMLNHWVSIGYETEQVVDRVGTFSRRGGIVDVWSPAHLLPVRIELFGNVADSIRYFDPGTQRSSAPLKEVTVTPMDLLLSPSGREVGGEGSLLDYLAKDALLILDDEVELRDAWRTLEEKAQRERETATAIDDSGARGRAPLPNMPYITWEQFVAAKARVGDVIALGQAIEQSLSLHPLAQHFSQPPHFAGQLSPLLDYIKTQRGGGAEEQGRDEKAPHLSTPASSLTIVSRQSARLAEVWSERNSAIAAQADLDELPHGSLAFVVGALPAGFVWKDETSLTLLTDAEIYGQVRPEWFLRGRARKAAPEKAFSDWQMGDAVVHEDYGVGIYRGLVKLTVSVPSLPVGEGAGASARANANTYSLNIRMPIGCMCRCISSTGSRATWAATTCSPRSTSWAAALGRRQAKRPRALPPTPRARC